MKAQIVFMGTPEFSVASLAALCDAGYDIRGVVTNEDQPGKRGEKLVPSPVKIFSQRHKIPIFQPQSPKSDTFYQQMKKCNPDCIIVSAYGHILPRQVISIPSRGTINIHASLLPGLRGPSPIQYAILQKKKYTGITIMRMDEHMDTGDIIAQKKVRLSPRETASTLHDKLAKKGATYLIEILPKWFQGVITPLHQKHSLATYTTLIKKEDGQINWKKRVSDIDAHIRAYTPWPGAFTFLQTSKIYKSKKHSECKRLRILRAHVSKTASQSFSGIPGTLFQQGYTAAVNGKDGIIILERVQLEGKKPISGIDFVKGYHHLFGEQFE